jgi:hypothetical protein
MTLERGHSIQGSYSASRSQIEGNCWYDMKMSFHMSSPHEVVYCLQCLVVERVLIHANKDMYKYRLVVELEIVDIFSFHMPSTWPSEEIQELLERQLGVIPVPVVPPGESPLLLMGIYAERGSAPTESTEHQASQASSGQQNPSSSNKEGGGIRWDLADAETFCDLPDNEGSSAHQTAPSSRSIPWKVDQAKFKAEATAEMFCDLPGIGSWTDAKASTPTSSDPNLALEPRSEGFQGNQSIQEILDSSLSSTKNLGKGKPPMEKFMSEKTSGDDRSQDWKKPE